MSTKTLRKRIALVAVSALTAGLVSVVAVPSANAAAPTIEHFYLGTTASTTGAAGITAVGTAQDNTDLTSTGLIVAAASDLSTAATTTGVILPTAQLSFSWQSAAKTAIVVTGGVVTTARNVPTGGLIAAAIPISSSLTSAYNATLGVLTVGNAQAIVATTAAVGSVMTVAVYSGANVSATSPSAGTLVGLYTFTVAAAGTAGTPDVAQSAVYIQAPIAKTAAIAGTNAYDSTNSVPNGQAGVAYVLLKDAYKSPVSTTGTVTATATNGATVKISDTTSTATPFTATSSFDSMANSDGVIYYVVNQPVANTAGESTVTFTYAGTVIGTKTFKWSGDIATLTVDTANSATSFINGYALATPIVTNPGAIGNVVYVAKDAAGNAVTLTAQPTVDSAAGAMVGATVYSANTAVNGGEYQTASVGYGYTTMSWGAATTLYGAGSYRLKLTNAAGVSIYSAVQQVKVSSGGPNSFAVSWNKAIYNPGDIATLTITAKDIYGNAVGAGSALAGLTAGLIVSTGGFTSVGTACVNASYTDSNGAKTCTFAVGNTEGAYSYSIDLDTVTAQSPLVGSLKIVSSSTGVSNADVLKAIVSLIASINKQIAALQKALLKR
jgi:trimeric autotransporter adhesin